MSQPFHVEYPDKSMRATCRESIQQEKEKKKYSAVVLNSIQLLKLYLQRFTKCQALLLFHLLCLNFIFISTFDWFC